MPQRDPATGWRISVYYLRKTILRKSYMFKQKNRGIMFQTGIQSMFCRSYIGQIMGARMMITIHKITCSGNPILKKSVNR